MRPQTPFKPHVKTMGSGARRALALHCTMAFGGAWKGLSDQMAELTVVAPDMPSHGRSADWDGVSSFGDTVLAGAISALDVDAPMDVFGHSFGAMSAIRLAVAHPDRVRSLVLIEPVFFAVACADAPQTLDAHDQDATPFKDAIAAGDWEGAARFFNRMWSAEAPAWATLPERTRAAMIRGVRVVPDTYDLLYNDTAGLLKTPGVSDIDIPTLLVRGGDSHSSIAAINDGLARRMPQASQQVIPGAGHMAPISHPHLVAEAIRNFWSKAEIKPCVGTGQAEGLSENTAA